MVPYLCLCLRKVALVHSLQVPVSKEASWLGDTMRWGKSPTISIATHIPHPRSFIKNLEPIVPHTIPLEEREQAKAVAMWDLR